jgi:hypothetical protein
MPRGGAHVTSFTPTEINAARHFMTKVLPLFQYDFRVESNSVSPAKLGSQTGAKRLARAMYFCSVARSQLDLGVGIVNYCTVFESLFSTDASELSHKVSHRTAIFIGGNPDQKVVTYTLCDQRSCTAPDSEKMRRTQSPRSLSNWTR